MAISSGTSKPAPLQRSTEHHGLGQSGYTAGRNEGDAALERELEPLNETYPRNADEELIQDALGTDERFIGRGGSVPGEREEPRPPRVAEDAEGG